MVCSLKQLHGTTLSEAPTAECNPEYGCGKPDLLPQQQPQRKGEADIEVLQDPDREKAKLLASWLKDSKHAVVYTGAGLSTSAGIPDYRGPQGVWALRAKGLTLPEPNFFQIQPTLSHKVISALVEKGHVKHVVTQNIDDLHRRSGVPEECLSELHGNFCLELCPGCGARYYRPFPVWHGLTSYTVPTSMCSSASLFPAANLAGGSSEIPTEIGPRKKRRTASGGWAFPGSMNGGISNSGSKVMPQDDPLSPRSTLTNSAFSETSSTSSMSAKCSANTPSMETGRHCEHSDCGAKLQRSVVLFGEDLSEQAMDTGMETSESADLALVLGSSLSVGPACDLPGGVPKQGGRLVIINLSPTPFDKKAALVIRAKCDEVMAMVAEELGWRDVPETPFPVVSPLPGKGNPQPCPPYLVFGTPDSTRAKSHAASDPDESSGGKEAPRNCSSSSTDLSVLSESDDGGSIRKPMGKQLRALLKARGMPAKLPNPALAVCPGEEGSGVVPVESELEVEGRVAGVEVKREANSEGVADFEVQEPEEKQRNVERRQVRVELDLNMPLKPEDTDSEENAEAGAWEDCNAALKKAGEEPSKRNDDLLLVTWGQQRRRSAAGARKPSDVLESFKSSLARHEGAMRVLGTLSANEGSGSEDSDDEAHDSEGEEDGSSSESDSGSDGGSDDEDDADPEWDTDED